MDAGTSSLFQASGGSVDIHGSGYEGSIGAGNLAGEWVAGGFLRTEWRGSTLSFGDSIIPFRIPTDIFDTSHYFLGRGLGVTTSWRSLSIYGFGGTSSTGFASPYFSGARSENAIGALFLDAKLSPTLQVFSRNIISGRQTSISGLAWQPRPRGVKMAVAGGTGAGQGYLSSSLVADRSWFSVKAAYIVAGDQFRRIIVQAPLNAENDRENLLVTLRPASFLNFTAGRFNLLQPVQFSGGPQIRAAVDEFTVSATAERFTLTGSSFSSRARGVSSEGTSLALGRDFARRFESSVELLHSRSTHSRAPRP